MGVHMERILGPTVTLGTQSKPPLADSSESISLNQMLSKFADEVGKFLRVIGGRSKSIRKEETIFWLNKCEWNVV